MFDLNVGFSLVLDIRHSKFECEIQFVIRYSTFDLNVGFSLIFDIGHSKFKCEIEFDIRYLTFDSNVGFSLIFSILDIQNLNVRLSLIFDI